MPKASACVKASQVANLSYSDLMKLAAIKICLAVLLAPMAVETQQAQSPTPKSFSELYPPMPGVEYYCTDAQGSRVELGQIICVNASCQIWMARCEMAVSNGTAMWRKVQDGCPVAGANDTLKRLQALKNTL